MKLLDCTLRDGGYYNNWDFPRDVVNEYLKAMEAIEIDYVEIGMRSLVNNGYKGAYAYSTDEYLNSLSIPKAINIGVMINASEIVNKSNMDEVLEKLFGNHNDNSPVSLVRIACHVHEFVDALPASLWLKERGYMVGFNLMQASDKTKDEFVFFAKEAQKYPIDVLYFADSMGSMGTKDITNVVSWLRVGWEGAIGIHAHDNIGKALQNTLVANEHGATWLDATITGMGRGPGNTQTEYLVVELCDKRDKECNLIPLMEIITQTFTPMKNKYGWGTNPYYYLAGKYAIHPSYIQAMLVDNRYSEEDILAVIEHLKIEGGKKFNIDTLESSREFYKGNAKGSWNPIDDINSNTVLIIGTGPSTLLHIDAIESYIKKNKPYVIALNTKQTIKESLIDARAACHPMRLLADCNEHLKLEQPLITPISMLPDDIKESLKNKNILDFGLIIQKDTFLFEENFATLPTSLVIAYTLAIATSGNAVKILLAGFDGYSADDPRNFEMDNLFKLYLSQQKACKLFSITPSKYRIPTKSIYGFINGEKNERKI